MKGIVLAGTASGVGKTVATLAVIRALEAAGHRVQPAKAGPDYIDPSHHDAIADSPSRTLDPWLQGEAGLHRNYRGGAGDVCVIEGVMGLYDGDRATTAAVAAALDLPVVLVVDASGRMESVGATALGYRQYAEHAGLDVDVAGLIAQRAHGGTHEQGIRDSLPAAIDYLGRIPTDEALTIPDRHLGLHMGEEAPVPVDALDAAAEGLDVEAIVELARAPASPAESCSAGHRPRDPPAPDTDATVALAHDPAFRFVYPATLERLRSRATVRPFSPVAGDPLPACDGIYLPGGYPELHAEALAASPTLAAIADRAADGLPIYGECGGMMALGQELTTSAGETHDMAGVLPVSVRMHDRLQALEMTEFTATRTTPAATAGATRRGHEFHYSSATVEADARFGFEMVTGAGIDGEHDGLVEYATVGTYSHVHPASGAFDDFLEAVVDGDPGRSVG